MPRPSVHPHPDCPRSAARGSMRVADSLPRQSVPATGGCRVLSARLRTPPTWLHHSALFSGLHPYPPAVAPSARWTAGARPCRDARSIRSPRRLALRLGAVVPTRSPPLLRPLLTARSTESRTQRRPFRHEASSPQVRLIDCPCTSAGSTERLLGRKSFAVIGPLALIRPASYPVAVRHPAGLATPLLSTTLSRLPPCGSLGSLRPTPQRTSTSKSIVMLGTPTNRARPSWPGPSL